MNSGMTVDLLDHVFMGCFSSTNGPFLAERPIYYLLRLIINLSEYLPFLLVLKPLASMPSRETGCGLPCPDLPSPPPCGWSCGFIATPLTVGRMPNHLFFPAFPIDIVPCSTFPTWPIVA